MHNIELISNFVFLFLVYSPFQADHSRNGSTVHDKSSQQQQQQMLGNPAYSPYLQSPYRTNSSPPSSPESGPIYGDTTLRSPEKRTFRRLL